MFGLGLAVAAAVAILDQASKAAVLDFFSASGCAPHGLKVTAFFDLVVTCNRGMSFGLFNHRGGVDAVVFTAIAAAIILGLLYWLRRVAHPLLAVGIGLIIGGALGNVIDRLHHGAVVDFLYFHIGKWYWPAFNLADSAICLGVGIMLLDGLLLHRQAN